MIWLTILLCFIWGFNFIIMKIALDYFPPVLFSTLRFLLGASFLLIICFYKKIPLPRKKDWKWYALCGVLQTSYVFIVNQQALQYLDAGLTSLLVYTMPIWFAVLAHCFIGERLTSPKIFALVLGLIGLFLVLKINPLQFKWYGIALLAQLFVLSGAAAWAISNIIVKKFLDNHDKWQFTAYQMVIGALVLFLYSFLFEKGQTITWSWEAIIILLYSGIIASSFAFVLWFYLLGSGEGGKASLSLLLVPAVSILFGVILLDETMGLTTIIGIIVILIAIGLINIKQNRLPSTNFESQVENHINQKSIH
ncbi:MAG TPA: EamA family transporter [Bacillales bacterium]|nr:EamA family transporter [Bacillales bacterium]